MSGRGEDERERAARRASLQRKQKKRRQRGPAVRVHRDRRQDPVRVRQADGSVHALRELFLNEIEALRVALDIIRTLPDVPRGTRLLTILRHHRQHALESSDTFARLSGQIHEGSAETLHQLALLEGEFHAVNRRIIALCDFCEPLNDPTMTIGERQRRLQALMESREFSDPLPRAQGGPGVQRGAAGDDDADEEEQAEAEEEVAPELIPEEPILDRQQVAPAKPRPKRRPAREYEETYSRFVPRVDSDQTVQEFLATAQPARRQMLIIARQELTRLERARKTLVLLLRVGIHDPATRRLALNKMAEMVSESHEALKEFFRQEHIANDYLRPYGARVTELRQQANEDDKDIYHAMMDANSRVGFICDRVILACMDNHSVEESKQILENAQEDPLWTQHFPGMMPSRYSAEGAAPGEHREWVDEDDPDAQLLTFLYKKK